MIDWKSLLKSRKLLVADGAWGTELSKRGLPNGVAPEAWNLERPGEVRAVASSYVQAGAGVILANSFGGNRFKLEKSGLADRMADVNRAAASLSLQAADGKALVFASVGATGEFMEPLGSISEQQMVDCYAEQISALAEEGVQGVCIETFTDLNEALAALRAARQCGPIATVVSLTYDKGAAGYATMMGVRPEQAAPALDAAGADIIGANCGAGMDNMIEIIRHLRGATRRPLWAKPNAGLPQLVDGRTVFRETPEQMCARFGQLAKAGARFIGGCCGTTPNHIRLFAAEAKTFVAANAALFDGDDLKL